MSGDPFDDVERRHEAWGWLLLAILVIGCAMLLAINGCQPAADVLGDSTYPQSVETIDGHVCQVIHNPQGDIVMPSKSCPVEGGH